LYADDNSTQKDCATATHNAVGPQVPQQRHTPVKHISNNPAQQPSIQTFSKDSTSPIIVQPQQNGASQKSRPLYQNCGTARIIYIPGQPSGQNGCHSRDNSGENRNAKAHAQSITGPFVILNPFNESSPKNGNSSQNGLQSRDLSSQTKIPTLNGNSAQPTAGALTSLTTTSTTANEQRAQYVFQPMGASNDPTGLSAALADPKLKQQTLVEINRSILNSYYTFKLGAPLKNYILKKRKSIRESYTLAEVRTIFINTST
jgi:hypothetical protein